MSDSPPYKIYDESIKPEYVFEMQNGNWVGIWGYDWADLLGKNITRLDENIIFEIWQPDLRADKIYNAEISDRVCHKLFPADKKRNLLGAYNYSGRLLQEIFADDNAIYQLGLPNSYYYEVLNNIKSRNKIVGTNIGEIRTPSQNIFKLRKNHTRTIGHVIEHFKFKKTINRYNAITYISDININGLKKLYNGKLYKTSVGIDTSVFKRLDKNKCRRELNLHPDKKIILSVGRLNSAKQIHKLINILSDLSDKFDFTAIFIGHGEREYENYLKKISKKLSDKNQILFTGYVDIESLVKYYNSADIFFMSSAGEGAPVVSIEALSCGTPVISTDTGNVAEFIKEHAKNNILGRFDYSGWKFKIINFLQGSGMESINVELVKEKYSWESVSKKFIEIYRSL